MNPGLDVFMYFALSPLSHSHSIPNLHWTRSAVHARKDSSKV